MKKSELIFRNLSKEVAFIEDISFMLSIPENKLLDVLDVYLQSQYRAYYHKHLGKFSDKIKLPIDDAHSLILLLDLLAYRIVPKHEVKDVLSALNEMTDKKAEVLRNFLNKLKEKSTQEILENLDLIDNEIGNLNPHIRDIEFNLQNRVVLKGNTIIKKIPVVTLQLITNNNKDKNIVELLEDDLDNLIKGLNEVKEKLKIIQGDKNETPSSSKA